MTATATWVLVGDAKGARILSFEKRNTEWTVLETIAGDGSGHPDQTADFGPKASEHKGALHAHGEPVVKETQERRFAHTLARVLEKGLLDKAFSKLVLVAPPKLLGDLRENLSRPLHAAVVAGVAKDYTHNTAAELAALLRPELPPL